jgi:hypothetical protein
MLGKKEQTGNCRSRYSLPQHHLGWQSGTQNLMAVDLEVGRFDSAWRRLPVVEEEEFHFALILMFALKRFNNRNPNFLLKAASLFFGIMLIQSFPVEGRIEPMLDRLPKPLAFRNRQCDVVNVPKFTDHAI